MASSETEPALPVPAALEVSTEEPFAFCPLTETDAPTICTLPLTPCPAAVETAPPTVTAPCERTDTSPAWPAGDTLVTDPLNVMPPEAARARGPAPDPVRL